MKYSTGWISRGSVRPFTLCLECNTPLHSIDKAEVLMRMPPSIRERFDHFSTCDTLPARLLGRVALAAHAGTIG